MFELYKIKENDTLGKIGDMYNIDEREIRKANRIESDEIKEGMQIIIPIKDNLWYFEYTVKDSDTIYKIARKYNVDPKYLAIINDLEMDEYIYENDILKIPKENVTIYVTEKNDTLKKVKEKLNINYEKLLNDNPNIFLLENQLIIRRKI